MKKTLIIGGVVILIIVAGVLLSKNSKVDEVKINEPIIVDDSNLGETRGIIGENETQSPEDMANTGNLIKNKTNPVNSVSKVASITISGGNFSFTPNVFKVKEGDTVNILFKNVEGTHDLVVEGYDVRTKILNAGQEETISFVASKTGTFEYYCSVGQHRQMGMKGTLTVE